jgi:transposase InsO family protein
LAPERAALSKATLRYETAPGEQGQADWAYCGRLRDEQGQERPVYAFLVVLGFSRLLHVSLSTDMRLETLIRCHEEAFAALGGAPATLLYDNMKQVRLSPTCFNPLFVDFAAHWGWVPATHRVGRPRTKGKVERMVDYLKEGFLRGRTFVDLADARAQLQHWLDHTANVRVHATTQQRPVDLWAVERPLLRTPLAPYRLASRAVRTVSAEGWVHYQGARYSVPPAQVGQKVLVEVCAEQRRVVIRADQVIVAEHPQATKRGATLSDPAHVAALWELTLTPRNPAPPPWAQAGAEGVAVRPLSVSEALVS